MYSRRNIVFCREGSYLCYIITMKYTVIWQTSISASKGCILASRNTPVAKVNMPLQHQICRLSNSNAVDSKSYCSKIHCNLYHLNTAHCSVVVALTHLGPRQNGRHFPDDIFKYIFLNEYIWILIKISLEFVPKGSINNIPALVQVMAWRRPGDKPLSEPMMV